MLTTDELEDMREEMTASFPDSVDVLQETAESDGSGGSISSWEVANTYPGRLTTTTKAGTEPVEGGAAMAIIAWKLLLPWNATVGSNDRCRITGVEYTVLGTNGGQAESLALEVYLRKL